uniref:Galectin n=1 Tax=Jaculus jaculus TaxID=51337 RepID=A0A8C5LAF8_JACJA
MMLSLNNLQNIIYNPVIPCVGTISEQLKPGSLIVIRGYVPSDVDRFQVDLQHGSLKPRADVVFHFNPRFQRINCIVCNTLTNEKWGWEDFTYDMPFKKKSHLRFKFQVAVNGKHTLLYAHRIDLEKIDTLGVYGKVNIHSIGFSFSSDLQSTETYTLGLAERMAGKSKDIALHLNPRLNIKAFVRNSFLHDAWGEGERNITCFPFSPGMYFEMIVYCDVREFKVAVNGVNSLEYKHRFKELGNVDTLVVDGNIHLLDVRSW